MRSARLALVTAAAIVAFAACAGIAFSSAYGASPARRNDVATVAWNHAPLRWGLSKATQ